MGYTTLEESKLLVSLGLSPETADMHYWNAEGKDYVYVGKSDNVNSESCWSLDALINLFPIGNDAPVFTLTRCGTDIKTEQHNNDWYAEWESDDTYLVFNDKRAVAAVVKLLAKLVQDKRITLKQ